MKISIVLSVVLLSVSGISCFDYNVPIQGAIDDIKNQLVGLRNLFNNYFFTDVDIASYFDGLDTSVSHIPEAHAHISTLRNNYADLVSTINDVITHARANVVANIESKYEIVDSKFPLASRTGGDVENILTGKSCSTAQIETFINNVVDDIQVMVQSEINQIVGDYEQLIFNGYVPLWTLEKLRNHLYYCTSPSTDKTIKGCLLRMEQLYQTNYFVLVKDSFQELERIFVAFNNQITINLLQKVDEKMLDAVNSALTHTC